MNSLTQNPHVAKQKGDKNKQKHCHLQSHCILRCDHSSESHRTVLLLLDYYAAGKLIMVNKVVPTFEFVEKTLKWTLLTSESIPRVSPISVAHQTIKYEKKTIHSIDQTNVHGYQLLLS